MTDLDGYRIVAMDELDAARDRLWAHILSETREGMDIATLAVALHECTERLLDGPTEELGH